MPVEVKICGLSTPETVDAAVAAGADFVGFVFFPKSPRHVTLEQAAALAARARGKAKIVTLVVDADDALLSSIAAQVAPDLIQAHGSETPERVAEIARLTGKPVIKAIRVKDDADISAAAGYSTVASLILYDAKVPETLGNALPGGNGHGSAAALATVSSMAGAGSSAVTCASSGAMANARWPAPQPTSSARASRPRLAASSCCAMARSGPAACTALPR